MSDGTTINIHSMISCRKNNGKSCCECQSQRSIYTCHWQLSCPSECSWLLYQKQQLQQMPKFQAFLNVTMLHDNDGIADKHLFARCACNHRPVSYTPSGLEREWGERIADSSADPCAFIRSHSDEVDRWLAALQV